MNKKLVSWYEINKRDLPWRRSSDPYKIWISEIMLQQTQVNTVIPYFERFMKKFPTISDLANAPLEDVLKMWEGLGYYSRARNIHKTAKTIRDEYQGIFPRKYEDVIKLSGIGPYTAGAIMSIAYQKAYPAVDGNVFRVFSRLELIWDDISKPKTRSVFEDAVMKQLDGVNPQDFNQALMDLGATICTPKNPKCMGCPIQDECKGYLLGYEDELPVKLSKTKQVKIPMVVGIIQNEAGELLIRKRPDNGLLANMYEFIQCQGLSDEELIPYLEKHFELDVIEVNKFRDFKHVFSHRIWLMEVYLLKVTGKSEHFMSLETLHTLPMSTAHKKILLKWEEEQC